MKFVLADRADYEWAREVIREHSLDTKVNAVLLSSVFGKLPTKDLVEWALADKLPARVQLQMHKYIWEPSTTGV